VNYRCVRFHLLVLSLGQLLSLFVRPSFGLSCFAHNSIITVNSSRYIFLGGGTRNILPLRLFLMVVSDYVYGNHPGKSNIKYTDQTQFATETWSSRVPTRRLRSRRLRRWRTTNVFAPPMNNEQHVSREHSARGLVLV